MSKNYFVHNKGKGLVFYGSRDEIDNLINQGLLSPDNEVVEIINIGWYAYRCLRVGEVDVVIDSPRNEFKPVRVLPDMKTVINLPAPKEGVWYLVSSYVAPACFNLGRTDIVELGVWSGEGQTYLGIAPR